MNEEITRVVFRKWFAGAILVAVVALVATFLLFPGVSHALTIDQEALVGLKGVGVLIDIKPEAERLGLTKDRIKTDFELRLRKAGIRVLTEEEISETPGVPHLFVGVGTRTLVSPNRSFVRYSISVKLVEMVTLARGFKVVGTIWEKGGNAEVRTSEIREIRENIGYLVDKFINDYLAANPK